MNGRLATADMRDRLNRPQRTLDRCFEAGQHFACKRPVVRPRIDSAFPENLFRGEIAGGGVVLMECVNRYPIRRRVCGFGDGNDAGRVL